MPFGFLGRIIESFAKGISASSVEKMLLQRRNGLAELSEPIKGNFTDCRGFHGLGRAGMALLANAVHANDFAREVKAGNLLDSLIGQHHGFDTARAHRING